VAGQKKLDGKVTIVTGAGSSGPGVGTGKAISVQFAQEGAKVVLVDMFEERAQETLDMIKAEGGEAKIVVADLSKISECKRVVDETVKLYGGVDILINNAALSASGTGLLKVTEDYYEKVIAVNLTAPFMLCKYSIPIMIERGGGSIINITSIAAMRGTGSPVGNGAYATAKAGLEGLRVDIADAFGKKGIRINNIAPGIIVTPMQKKDIANAGLDFEKLDLGKGTALGIAGDAWDIARAALFLAGPDGRFITSQLIAVDGGKTQTAH
jgi:NAD(P)-dependent dehydrogenase (short-subunit alcohol dehydrogenase family)